MAVDTQKLFYLLDPVFQIENLAGKPVVGGHIEVFVAGTDTKYITWQDWGGARNPFKIPLKSDGRAVILVEPQYTYDVYVYDSFNNMVCSRLNVSPAIGGDVSVSGLTQVYHDETISGNGTPYEPLGIVSGGKTYEGIEPIVVNNDVNKISANNVALGLQEPLFFVEDSETACVIGCSAQTEIPSALSGKWDNASDVVIANSAQWAEHTEYEAGSYVDIDGHTINITGLQPEGDYAYNSALSSKLDVTALPQDLVHSGDLTAYQSAGNYLSASDSGKFYPMEGNPSGFLTEHQSLDDYATKQWVEDKGYITGIDIPESAVWNATTQTVSANSAAWAGGTANPQIPVTGINGIKISESGDKVVFEVSADYYPGNNPSGFITGVDLSDYATTAQVAEKQDSLSYGYHDTVISSIDNSAIYDTSAHARINTLAGRISDLSSNKLDSSAFSDVSGTFLTAVDLTPYQTTAGMTAYQSAGDYLTTADSANFYTTANESGFITGVDLAPYQEKADMTAYATVESLTAKQDAGDYLSATDSANFLLTSDSGNFYPMTANPSGYINELPEEEEVEFEEIDLAAYQTVSAMTGYQSAGDYYSASNPSGFITEVPAGTMNESAFGYDANDKISGYNGSAFAGGSEVPEGVMVESGLEYNAVNEISGYNGSAIAQYGAEKQWLVHDDTLVHASNSAQYALGVNLSAVAQLLGVDETILFESANAVTNAPLSESMTAFNRVRVSLANDFTDTGLYQTVIDLDVEHGSHVWEPVGGLGITNMWVGVNMLSANTDYTILTAPKAKLINFGNWTAQGTGIVGSTTGANVNVILKVIGIGRKS